MNGREGGFSCVWVMIGRRGEVAWSRLEVARAPLNYPVTVEVGDAQAFQEKR